MTRRAFYKRYPGDWIMGTRDLTLEERGAYSDLVDMMFDRGGPLPDEPRWLAGLLGISTKRWNAIRASLLAAGKLEAKGDYLSNRRAMRELGQEKAEVEKQVHWGRMGGKRRAENEKKLREAALKESQEELFGNGGKPPKEGKAPLDAARPTQKPAKSDSSRDFRGVFDEFSADFGDEKSPLPKTKANENNDEAQGTLKPARASHIQSPEEETKVSPPLTPPKPKTKPSRKKAQNAKRIPKSFDAREALTNGTGDMVEAWPDGMFERETEKFLDWAASNGTTSKDWTARFRNWLRKADDEWRRQGSRPLGKPSGWNFATGR